MLNSYDLCASALRIIRHTVTVCVDEDGGDAVAIARDGTVYSMFCDAFDGIADTHTVQCVLLLAGAMVADGDDLRDFRGTCEFIHRMAC